MSALRLKLILGGLALALLLPAGAGASVPAALVKDIEGGPAGSGPQEIVELGGVAYFSARDSHHGSELWRSDGTREGTWRVSDINPGIAGSLPSNMRVIDETIWFAADDGTHGSELFKSDGTPAGTGIIADINPGPPSSAPKEFTKTGSRVLFSATTAASGNELFRSGGSVIDTVPLGNIAAGNASSFPHNLTRLPSGRVLFSANDGLTGSEIYSTDVNGGNPAQVEDVNAGAGDGLLEFGILAVGNSAFFTARDGASGNELYKSDGTPGSAVQVDDINPGAGDANPTQFAELDGDLVFSANDGATGNELYRSDGTAAGTGRLADIFPGATSSGPAFFTPLGDTLLFIAASQGIGVELFRTDGTGAGTALVEDIRPGNVGSLPSQLAVSNGAVYFEADDGVTGSEPYRSTGTAAGTDQVLDVSPGPGSSNPAEFTDAGGTTVFDAGSVDTGAELFGTLPIAQLSGSGAFGSTAVGAASARKRIVVANTGIAPMHVADLDLVGVNGLEFSIEAEACTGERIASGADCRVDVSFSPTSAGAKSALLQVESNDSDGAKTIALSGTGTGPPDGTDPEVSFTSGPAGLTNDSTPSFGFAMNEPGTLHCRIDGGSFGTCSSPKTTPALSEGPHVFEVRGTDGAGNRGSAERQILVDTAPPQTKLAAVAKKIKAKKKKAKILFDFSAAESGARFECSIDGAVFSTCTAPLQAGFGKGTHTFAVRASDRAANTDPTPAQAGFTVKVKKKKKK